jgi:hypothetical protein
MPCLWNNASPPTILIRLRNVISNGAFITFTAGYLVAGFNSDGNGMWNDSRIAVGIQC